MDEQRMEICPDCNGAGGDNQHTVCGKCNGSGGVPTADLGEEGELVERMNRAWRHFYNTVENPPENLVRKLIDAVLSRSGG